MIDKLNAILEELELKRKEVKPKIDEINAKREEELQNVNKKYDHLISEVNYEIEKLENRFINDLIQSFENIVMLEFDAKRSSEMYSISDNFKDYRNSIAQFDLFPKELIERLDKVIDGAPIDNLAYDLENIKTKYIKS
ncbi:MAG: hypothetical protein ACFFHD_03685 [Promethearchaeota archaeon]